MNPGLESPSRIPATEAANAGSVVHELERIHGIEEWPLFLRELIDFAVAQTQARSGFVYGPDQNGRPVAQVVVGRPDIQVEPGAEILSLVDGLARRALESSQNQRATLRAGEQRLAALAVPVQTAPAGTFVLILLLGPERAPFLDPAFALLQFAAAQLLQHGKLSELARVRSGFLRATLLVDLLNLVEDAADYREALTLVAGELVDLLGCERIGIARGGSRRLKLEAVSGTMQIERRSQGNWSLLAFLRETTSTGVPMAWPTTPFDGPALLPASEQRNLLERYSVDQAIAFPLRRADGEIVGAWAALWKAESPWSEERIRMMEAVSPHLASMTVLLNDALPAGVRGKFRRFFRRASKAKQALALALPLVALGLFLIPVPHRVGAPARLTATDSRQVAAPFPGRLEEVFVKPGDTVEEGDLLARLDGREIGWRLAEAVAKRESALKRRDQAKAAKDVSETQMAEYEQEALGLEVELLRYRRDHLEIRSPVNGLVLSGDLERSRGVPVETGQKLYEIAPLDRMKLEMAVPDEDVHWVEPGLPIELRLESRPGESLVGEVEEVYPVAEVKDGENVYVSLATFPNDSGRLRPGMRGRVKITSGWKPLGWVLFHKPWNYVRVRWF